MFDTPMYGSPSVSFPTMVEKNLWSVINDSFNVYDANEYGVTIVSNASLSSGDNGVNTYCQGDIEFTISL